MRVAREGFGNHVADASAACLAGNRSACERGRIDSDRTEFVSGTGDAAADGARNSVE